MCTTHSELEKVFRQRKVALRSREVQEFSIFFADVSITRLLMRQKNLGFIVDFELARCDDGLIEGCGAVQKFINIIAPKVHFHYCTILDFPVPVSVVPNAPREIVCAIICPRFRKYSSMWHTARQFKKISVRFNRWSEIIFFETVLKNPRARLRQNYGIISLPSVPPCP